MTSCRACARSKFDPVEKVYNLTGEWMHIYTFCTSVELAKHDFLSRTVCQSCYDSLIKFYSFKNQCIQSNLILLEACNKIKSEQDAEPVVKTENEDEHFSDDFPDDRSIGSGDVPLQIKFESSDEKHASSRPASEKKPKKERANKLCAKVKNKSKKRHQKYEYKAVKQPRKLVCPRKHCNRSYNHQDAYELHFVKYHRGIKNVEIECHKCKSKKFRSFDELRLHDAFNHFQKECQCPTCGKTFRSQLSLKCHRRSHNKKMSFVCHVCGKSLFSNDSLKRHHETHLAFRERSHECEKCGKTFMSKEQLRKHMRFHRERTHVCPVCQKAFSEKQGLRKHSVVHMAVKPFLCKVCNKRYSTAWFLQQHVRTHSGEKPFACAHCPMTFSSKQYLVGHAKLHAKEESKAAAAAAAACANKFAPHANHTYHHHPAIGVLNAIASTFSADSAKC